MVTAKKNTASSRGKATRKRTSKAQQPASSTRKKATSSTAKKTTARKTTKRAVATSKTKKTPAKKTAKKSAKATPAAAATQKKSGRGLLGELFGLLLMAFGILLVSSIYAHQTNSKSLVGRWGSLTADTMFYLLGAGTYAATLAALAFGAVLLLRRPWSAKFRALIGYMGMIAGVSMLASLWFEPATGGILGQYSAPPLRATVGMVGGSALMIALLLFFSAVATSYSPTRIMLVCGRWCGKAAIKVTAWTAALFFDVTKWIVHTSAEAARERAAEAEAAAAEAEAAKAEAAAQKEAEEAQRAKEEKAAKQKRSKTPEPDPVADLEPIPEPTAKKVTIRKKADTPAPQQQIEGIPAEEGERRRSLGIRTPQRGQAADENEQYWFQWLEQRALQRAVENLESEIAAEQVEPVDDSAEPKIVGMNSASTAKKKNRPAEPKIVTMETMDDPPPAKPAKKKKSKSKAADQNGDPVITEHQASDDFDPNAVKGSFEAEETEAEKPYELPNLDLLDYVPSDRVQPDPVALKENAKHLEETLLDYNIEGRVTEIHPGPLITMYEFKPKRGTKISRIASLQDDLAMALAATSVRIVAPIPGKSVVGIEVPSSNRQTVYLKEIIAHPSFADHTGQLVMSMGKDIFGYPVVADLAKMPHLLVAGTTGSGKSVSVNAMLMSLLFRKTPAELRMILVDPKRLEFAFYENIPHLLLPVVTDPKLAVAALRWVVDEMDTRYQNMKEFGVKNIISYNKKVERLRAELDKKRSGKPSRIIIERDDDEDAGNNIEDFLEEAADRIAEEGIPEKLPYIVVVIDELADLMMVVGKDAEAAIARLAQLARAAGIHLIVATQRPSTDVITGLIKNNFPCRASFRVGDKVSSRVVLDTNGAEALLGFGDMLFMPPASSVQQRLHAPFVSEDEIDRSVSFIKQQRKPDYTIDIKQLELDAEGSGDAAPESDFSDPLYDQAIDIVCETGQGSASFLQRRLKVGYNRAARMIEAMEADGIVGPSEGSRPRKVLGRPLGGGMEE